MKIHVPMSNISFQHRASDPKPKRGYLGEWQDRDESVREGKGRRWEMDGRVVAVRVRVRWSFS